MSLPDEIRVGVTIDGITFDLTVRALPEGCSRLFPDRQGADEFRLSPDLPAAVVQVAASALDVAVSQFLRGFEASLIGVLTKVLDEVGTGAATPAQPEQAAA